MSEPRTEAGRALLKAAADNEAPVWTGPDMVALETSILAIEREAATPEPTLFPPLPPVPDSAYQERLQDWPATPEPSDLRPTERPVLATRCICSHKWLDHTTWCDSSGCPCRFTTNEPVPSVRESSARLGITMTEHNSPDIVRPAPFEDDTEDFTVRRVTTPDGRVYEAATPEPSDPQCKGYAGDPGASAPRCESYAGHPGRHFIRPWAATPKPSDLRAAVEALAPVIRNETATDSGDVSRTAVLAIIDAHRCYDEAALAEALFLTRTLSNVPLPTDYWQRQSRSMREPFVAEAAAIIERLRKG